MGFKSFKVVTFDIVFEQEDDFDDEFGGVKFGRSMMSLVTLFGGLKNVFKVKAYSTDNFLFRLHYKVTMGLLLGCALLITAVQLVTDPIICDVKGVHAGIFNAYCWTHATFTLPYRQKGFDGPKIQPGVGPLKPGVDSQQEAVYHGFYQWVGMALFGQALTFYIPHFLWKTCEGKKVERLVSGVSSPVVSEEIKKKHKVAIAEYFSCNKRRHILYGLRFVGCETLNLMNVSLQIYLIDRLLGGEFSTYGTRVLEFMLLDDEERLDPMVTVFPKVTKCVFHNFGTSGSIQRFDGLCVLPINTINDKIYIALWFWLLNLLICSTIFMVYRLVTMISPRARLALMKATAPSLNRKTSLFVKTQIGFGDWLILGMMSNHLDIKLFTDILKEIQRIGMLSQRSVSTHIDLLQGSDTEIENEDECKEKDGSRVSEVSTVTMIRKNQTQTDLHGLDKAIVQEMIADGYDPSQMSDWQQFRNHRIGDNEMATNHKDRGIYGW
ncbi:innexin inx2 [Eurytemora carolleeae]|uniref:innexin inx2 n=1 Tax=Eurytemora carolleeae TaxID=1294199 RepID=UPI000C77EE60|nr:innexin inx2 [Eurytemora carolleeae]|eukprot:XP_023329586.1 innexin inx2-like [Eurytemora affinis]